jgi:hypothetical protein
MMKGFAGQEEEGPAQPLHIQAPLPKMPSDSFDPKTRNRGKNAGTLKDLTVFGNSGWVAGSLPGCSKYRFLQAGKSETKQRIGSKLFLDSSLQPISALPLP